MKNRSQITKRVLSMLMAFAMILALLPAAVFAADAPTKLYLKPNSNWLISNARFAAYFFGNGEKWVSMTDTDGDGIYEVDVPSGYANVIFCRMNPTATANSWTNKWNQTADLTVPTDGTNLYTVASGTWDQGGGTWSTYTPAAEEETTAPAETTVPAAEPVTVYFVNAGAWDKVYAYVWDADNNYFAAWPGEEITATDETVNGFDVYEFTVDPVYENIIFSNGSASQSADQTLMDGQYFDFASNGWYESAEDIPYVDPLVTPHVLVGGFNEWSSSKNVFMLETAGGRIGYTSLDLEANTTYEFKIIQDGTWTSCATPITGNAEDLAFTSSVSGNATITTTVAGTYVFAFNLEGFTLSVTYPECNHNYVDGVCTNCGENEPNTCDHAETTTETVKDEVCDLYNVETCDLCGKELAHDFIETQHNPGDWIVISFPCTEDGAQLKQCLDCGSIVEQETIPMAGHKYVDGSCTVCLTPNPDYVEPVNATVYFVNSGEWDEDYTYAYVWDANQQYDVAWPGTVMTGTGETVNGFDVYEITVDASFTNIIFHDSLGHQTADLTLMDGQYYDFASNTWYESVYDIPGNETPAETMTIYFQNNWLWDDVCLYYWGSTAAEAPAWPGIPMELYGNDGTYDVYCLEVPTDIEGLIINGIIDDGSGNRDKTPNIEEGWYDGICYYMLWIDGNTVGFEDIDVILPDVAPAITREGSTLSLEDMIYVIDIFDLKGIDLTTIDLTTDAGLLAWSVEEFEALTEVAYDADHANAGLKAYMDTGCYYGASDGIFTRYLHEAAYYVGYVELADGTYIYSDVKAYSPADYAYNMLGKEDTSETTKTLCVSLLNYISAAQKYFYPETAESDLANKDLSAEQKTLVWDNPELNLAPAVPDGKQVARDTSVFAGLGKNLLMEEKVSLVSLYKINTDTVANAKEAGTIFWTAEQFEALSGAPSVENYGEGTKVTGLKAYRNNDGQWYSVAPKVAAKDMADTQYYILGYLIDADGTVSYSGVMSYTFEQYISNMVSKTTTSAVMLEFAQRLYIYERAAKAALG